MGDNIIEDTIAKYRQAKNVSNIYDEVNYRQQVILLNELYTIFEDNLFEQNGCTNSILDCLIRDARTFLYKPRHSLNSIWWKRDRLVLKLVNSALKLQFENLPADLIEPLEQEYLAILNDKLLTNTDEDKFKKYPDSFTSQICDCFATMLGRKTSPAGDQLVQWAFVSLTGTIIPLLTQYLDIEACKEDYRILIVYNASMLYRFYIKHEKLPIKSSETTICTILNLAAELILLQTTLGAYQLSIFFQKLIDDCGWPADSRNYAVLIYLMLPLIHRFDTNQRCFFKTVMKLFNRILKQILDNTPSLARDSARIHAYIVSIVITSYIEDKMGTNMSTQDIPISVSTTLADILSASKPIRDAAIQYGKLVDISKRSAGLRNPIRIELPINLGTFAGDNYYYSTFNQWVEELPDTMLKSFLEASSETIANKLYREIMKSTEKDYSWNTSDDLAVFLRLATKALDRRDLILPEQLINKFYDSLEKSNRKNFKATSRSEFLFWMSILIHRYPTARAWTKFDQLCSAIESSANEWPEKTMTMLRAMQTLIEQDEECLQYFYRHAKIAMNNLCLLNSDFDRYKGLVVRCVSELRSAYEFKDVFEKVKKNSRRETRNDAPDGGNDAWH